MRRHAGCACFLAFLRIVPPQLLFDGDQHRGSGGLVEKALGHGVEFLGWQRGGPGVQRGKFPRAFRVAGIDAQGQEPARAEQCQAGFGRQQRGFCARSDGLFRARQPTQVKERRVYGRVDEFAQALVPGAK